MLLAGEFRPWFYHQITARNGCTGNVKESISVRVQHRDRELVQAGAWRPVVSSPCPKIVSRLVVNGGEAPNHHSLLIGQHPGFCKLGATEITSHCAGAVVELQPS